MAFISMKSYNDICHGVKGCTHRLAKLHEVCEHACNALHPISFKEALNRLRKRVKKTLEELERTNMNKKIAEFCIGTDAVTGLSGVNFSCLKPATWAVDKCLGLRKCIRYMDGYYDGLIVVGCIDKFLIPIEVKKTESKAIVNHHVYVEGLAQALMHYFMFIKPDKRFNKFNYSEPKNQQDTGSLIFLAFRYEEDLDKEDNHQGIEENNLDERTDMKKVLQEQFKINREMSRRLELLEARVDNKMSDMSGKQKSHTVPDRLSPDKEMLEDKRGEKRTGSHVSSLNNSDFQKKRRPCLDEISLTSGSGTDQSSSQVSYNADNQGRTNVQVLELDCSSEEEGVMFMESNSNDNYIEDKNNGMILSRNQSMFHSSPYHSPPVPIKSFMGPEIMFNSKQKYTFETGQRTPRKVGPRFSSEEKIMILSCYLNQTPRGDWLGILDSIKSECGQLSRELQEYYQTSDRISLKRRIQDYVLGVLSDKRGRNERCAEVRELIDQIRNSTDDSYTVTLPTIMPGDMQIFDNDGGRTANSFLSEACEDGQSDYPVVCKVESE